MILNFEDEDGKKHFEFVFVGFILGGSIQQQKGMKVLQIEVGLFEKLEAISETKPCGKKLQNGEPDRQLKEGITHQVHVDLNEYDLLYNYMTAVPWQSGTPAKYALATINWIQRESRK